MPRYAELIYNGFWFSPEREMLQALIDKSQELVDRPGAAEALQGQRHVVGRKPALALRPGLVTFEDGAVAYDHNDAAGFIKLNALRLRTLAKRKKRAGEAVNGSLRPARFDRPPGEACEHVRRRSEGVRSASALPLAELCGRLPLLEVAAPAKGAPDRNPDFGQDRPLGGGRRLVHVYTVLR